MPRWRNSSQTRKGHSQGSDPELKAVIIRILAGLEKSKEDIRESLTADF